MRTPSIALSLCLAAILASARPAAAQSLTFDTHLADPIDSAVPGPVVSFDAQRAPYQRGRAGQAGAGVRLFGSADIQEMLARQSFSATTGSATVLGFGGGIDVVDIYAGLFFRAAVARFSKTGTRSEGTVSNGLALQIGMVPIDFAVGWRLTDMTRNHTLTPYFGGGAVLLRYAETTPSGATTDNSHAWFTGYEAFGGVDWRLTRTIAIAPEVDFRSFPGAIGTGGLSQTFNESNLGGVSVKIAIAFRPGGR